MMLFSSAGKAVRFNESEVRSMGRNAHGVRGIWLGDGQRVISLLVAEPGTVLTVGANGYGKRTPVEEFPTKGRGTKGLISMRIGERNAEQVGAVLVRPGDEIMLITESGTLVRTGVDDISVMGRNTWGVKLINLGEDQKLAGLERIIALNGDDDTDTDTGAAADEPPDDPPAGGDVAD
jgi:DNA gyrase subunit A